VNLVLIDASELDDSGVVRLEGDRATHLTRVLRVVPGQQIRVGLVDGHAGLGTVIEPGPHAVTLRCVFTEEAVPIPAVDLLLALPRPKVLRRLWAQIAALGVRRVLLTNAERVERNYFDTHLLTPDIYRPLLLEGLQQARDTHVPLVSIHRQFRVLVEDVLDHEVGDALRLVADPAGASSVAAAINAAPTQRVLLAVGPEGGWNAFELDLLAAHRFRSVSMGARTLRVDTACVALLAIINEARQQD